MRLVLGVYGRRGGADVWEVVAEERGFVGGEGALEGGLGGGCGGAG